MNRNEHPRWVKIENRIDRERRRMTERHLNNAAWLLAGALFGLWLGYIIGLAS